MREYAYYTQVLKDQLIPATGCTEPIALAYGAAMAYRTLGAEPERITAAVSGSIIKNVKSVVVPKTGGMKGIETAIAAGVVAGNPDLELEVLSGAPENTGALAKKFLEKCPVTVCLADSDRIFDIQITMYAGKHSAFVRIVDTHTNVVSVRRDETVLKERENSSACGAGGEDRHAGNYQNCGVCQNLPPGGRGGDHRISDFLQPKPFPGGAEGQLGGGNRADAAVRGEKPGCKAPGHGGGRRGLGCPDERL